MTDPKDQSEDERIRARMLKAMEPEPPERIAARKLTTARCGHVTRRLRKGERLTGDLLEFAIGTVAGNPKLVDKLKLGQPLDDYELHCMVDMYLLHARLA